MLCWGNNSPEGQCSFKHNLFIGSGSPFNPKVTQMLCWGHNSPGGQCCFPANYFYCLRLPMQSNPGGTQMLCWGNNSPGGQCCFAANSFYLSPAPHPIQSQGRQPKCYAGVIVALGVSAASQQTIFIVSGSPCNPIVGEVTQMLCWGNNSPGGQCCFAANSFYLSPAPHPIQSQGRQPKCYAGVMIVLGVSAASQQTLFIVSYSPSNPILGEVTQMLC